MTSSSEEEAASLLPAALNIAGQWSTLPPEHLRAALAALEPQLAREHELRMRAQRAREAKSAADAKAERLRTEVELEKVRADAAAAEAQQRRQHIHRMTGLAAGLVISVAMLAAAVLIADSSPWLAPVFAGPSLLALVRIFVLFRSDTGDLRQVTRATDTATAAQTAPPAAPPSGPPAGQPPAV